MGGGVNRELAARLALAAVVEPGDAAVGRAVRQQGAEAVWAALRAGTPPAGTRPGYALRAATVEQPALLPAVLACGARMVAPGDAEWPTQLADLGDAAPLLLFVRGGDVRLAAVRSLAVVGARAASAYGVAAATDLAAELADRGWSVVSGGAYGIDAAAHRGALAAAGCTVAVLACGVDTAYPRGNSALLDRLAADGTLVSELPPGEHPTRSRFLERNRVIAALTRGTLVIEAAARSGALNTAAIAGRLNRHVLGLPGPVTSPLSVGVHAMLRREETGCRLVTCAAEVVEEVGTVGELAPEVPRPVRARDGLAPAALATVEALPARGGVDVRRLAVGAALAEDEVRSALAELRLLGLVVEHPDGWALAPRP